MAKIQTSTRNPEFNYYAEGDTFYSSATKTATNSVANIILQDSDKNIKKSGAEIIKDAANNKILAKNNIFVDTSNLSEGDTYYIYGTPHKMVLDNRQQYNNCGPDSILNVLVLAGKKVIDNQNKTETAFTKKLWELGMVDDEGVLGKFDFYDGGTDLTGYKEIFGYYGLNVETYTTTKDENADVDGRTTSLINIADNVRKGGAAILAVSSDLLWKKEEPRLILNHAITITGVVYDTDTPTDGTQPVGFYIHDTGVWMTRYISYEELKQVSFEDKNSGLDKKNYDGVFATIITDNIKQATDNINATGTKYDNLLIGNSGNNTLKGLAGADILIGGAGNDKLYGGDGNDIMYGNGVLKEHLSDITDEAIKTKIENLPYLISEEDDKNLVGRNVLEGGNGHDYIFGGNYNDTIKGGNGNDYICGGDGTDCITGGSGKDIIYGDDGCDTIHGNDGTDYIYGGKGDDTLFGDAGNDYIWGGEGDDKVSCGSGNDNVYYEENFGADSLYSSSGSVTINLTDYSVNDLSYSMSGKSFVATYDEDNSITYTTFYNSSKNTYQKAYIKDNTDTAYRLSTTKSNGKVKVATTTGNNIFISQSKKNNTITTSTGNDIVYTLGGNDTITYTGGKDKYYSAEGSDTYKVNKFDTDTYLTITDSKSENDTLLLNTMNDNLRLFFDVEWDGETAIIDDCDLYFVNSGVKDYSKILSDEITGFVRVNKFFGDGNIENVSTAEDVLDISTSVEALAQDVANWLMDHTDYSTVFESIENQVEGYEDLIAIYANAQWNNAEAG